MINLTRSMMNTAVYHTLDIMRGRMNDKEKDLIMSYLAESMGILRSILFLTDMTYPSDKIDFPNSASKDSEDGSDPFDE